MAPGRSSARTAAITAPIPAAAIAHSFGCLALAHAATRYDLALAGSFLVAPADPQRFGIADAEVLADLGHRPSLVASTDDPWLSFERNRLFARAWGSRLHVLGAVGHINVDSGFGPWPNMLRWARAGRVDFPEFDAAASLAAAG